MKNKFELKLTGSGGQGLILGGIILAEAAILEGKNVVQSQSYGPEARGGSSKAEVVISDEQIDFPKALKTDLLLALTQESVNKYKDDIQAETIVMIDESLDETPITKSKNIVKVPIIKTAKEVVGKSIVANIVAIGALNASLKIVKKELLEEALLSRVPAGTEELNKRALSEGYKLIDTK